MPAVTGEISVMTGKVGVGVLVERHVLSMRMGMGVRVGMGVGVYKVTV